MAGDAALPYLLNGKRLEIRDVWAENLEEEMAIIREVVQKYPFIAMVSTVDSVVTASLGAGCAVCARAPPLFWR